jgi:hypothetical protein
MRQGPHPLSFSGLRNCARKLQALTGPRIKRWSERPRCLTYGIGEKEHPPEGRDSHACPPAKGVVRHPRSPPTPIARSGGVAWPADLPPPFDNCRPPSAKLRAGADHVLRRHTLRPHELVAPGLPGNVRHGVVSGRRSSHDLHTAIRFGALEHDHGNGYWHTHHRGKLYGREQFGVEDGAAMLGWGRLIGRTAARRRRINLSYRCGAMVKR